MNGGVSDKGNESTPFVKDINRLIAISDEPSIEDEFGIDAYSEGLATFIKKCNMPMTISIQGDWGSGKTSMLRRLKKSIEKEALCCAIDTWQYSQFELEDQLSLVFLECIMKTLRNSGLELKLKINDRLFKRALYTIAEYCTGKIPVIGNLSSEILKNIKDCLFEQELSPIEAITILKSEFETIVKELLEKDKKDRIVFFIDDLDRLPPEKAIEVMEVLKVILGCKHCVFVIAVDYEVIIRGVRTKYGSDMPDEKARYYFDKIIQVPFSLPVEKYKVKEYINKLLDGKGGTYGLREENMGVIADLARTSVGFNPRAIKRLVNFYILNKSIAEFELEKTIIGEKKRDGKRIEGVELILWASLCMQLAYQEMYKVLFHSCNSNNKADVNDFFENTQNLDDKAHISDYLKQIKLVEYSEDKQKEFKDFMGIFGNIISYEIDETDEDKRYINDRSFELLKVALNFALTSDFDSDESKDYEYWMPARYLYIYETLKIIKEKVKSTKDSFENGQIISEAKNQVAKKYGVTSATVSDKTTRRLGIDSKKFADMVSGFFNNSDDELLKIIREKNRDKENEEKLISIFNELRAN